MVRNLSFLFKYDISLIPYIKEIRKLLPYEDIVMILY